MPIVVPTTTKLDIGRVEARGLERGGDRRDGIAGFDGTLATSQRPAVVVDRDEVGERPAGVDAHP